MSIDATQFIWRLQGLRPAEKLVLLAMGDRADEDHCCWPSVKRLVLDTNLDRKTVIKVLSSQAEAGRIADTGRRTGRTKQIVVWRIVGVKGREDGRSVPQEQDQKRNGSETGTVPETEQSQNGNSSKTGTVPETEQSQNGNSSEILGKESQKRTEKGPKNGIRNLSGEPTKEPPTFSRSGDRERSPEARETPPVGDKIFVTKKRRQLSGLRLAWFEVFWEAYGYKHGKAEAADAWLDIKPMDNALCRVIVAAARREAEARPDQERAGQTPKWAQGWLTARRWEDEHGPAKPPAAEARKPSEYEAMVERLRQGQGAQDEQEKRRCV